ncbi:hypothetical protein [Nonomuraea sp. LPB2021202275-12-8]|uniref:hypothetical protein n=1 Tax=Nonomuraea sp. LPB2021202275-12-8 TaxID=3120159 RepID=UPI00300D389D
MTSPYDPPPGDDRHTQEGQWSQQQPPYQPPYPQPPKAQSTPVLSIIGFVCAAIALLFIPILFGIAGIVLGIVGHTRGESLGKWAAITAGVTMIVGMVLGYIVVTSMT